MKFARGLVVATMVVAGCMGASDRTLRAEAGEVIFRDGPRLGSPRATHALVRSAGGQLLAIGGCVADGCDPGPASATVDIIAPDATRLIGQGRLLKQRVQPAAVALSDGTALVIGGWVDRRVDGTTEIFDPATRASRAGPDLMVPRASPTVTVLGDGRVLIAGGDGGNGVLASAEVFDPATGKLAPVGPLGTARSGATGTLLPDGRVLIAGGGGGQSTRPAALASAEIFDPESGRFSPTGSLMQRRYKHGAVALPDGDVLILGGSDERDYLGKLDSVERYDRTSGRFVSAGRLARPRFKLASGLLLIAPGKVLVAAGDDHPEIFDLASGAGRLLDTNLQGQWNYMTIVATNEHRALLAGGYREGRIELTDRSWIVSVAPRG